MMPDTSEEQRSKYNFINEIVQKKKDETGEEPSTGFKVGYAIGFLLTSVGSVALEALAIGFAASVLGFSITFWQCLIIAVTFEYILVRSQSAK
jgi:hypothetical protein